MYDQGHRSGVFSIIVFSLFLIVAICVTAVYTTGSRFGSPTTYNFSKGETPASLLARRVEEVDVVETISDEDLTQIHEAIMKRAKAGEVEAAAFVFDLAVRQRKQARGMAANQPARPVVE